MRRYQPLRVLMLLSVVLVFAASTFVSYRHYVQTSRLASMAQKAGGWAASELEFELIKLVDIVELVGAKKSSVEALQLHFDLLWSRIDVLLVGSETREVRELPGALPLLHSLKSSLKQIEPIVTTMQLGDEGQVKKVLSVLKPYEHQVREFNIDSFTGPEAQARIQKAFQVNWLILASMIGLVLSGTLLILMLIRESSRNRVQSLHDELTGLPNRKYVNQKLPTAAERASKAATGLGIHIIDLNNFKEINDTLGHDCGDQLLEVIARRLRACVHRKDTVARLGGDEFLIIQEHVEEIEECTRLSRRLCEQIAEEVMINGHPIFPSASLGVSLYPHDAPSIEQVMINADLAMYRAKRDSGVSYRRFEREMNELLQRQNTLARDLKVALQEKQLVLHYQPVVSFETRRIESVEALLRWHHPDFGYISPLEVVAIAEQCGLVLELNEWVIEQACLQYRHWLDEEVGPVCVAINVSPSMYTLHDLCAVLSRQLAVTEVPAERLVIEVTEDTTMRDIESSPDIMRRLKEIGVQIALDDFGTGYSSLNHLKQLPVDKLKIDRSFIQDLNITPKDPRIIRSIIGLAKSLGLEIIAEGIEFEQNVKDLLAEGCLFGQGYLFSKALPGEEITEMLRTQKQGVYAFGPDMLIAKRETDQLEPSA